MFTQPAGRSQCTTEWGTVFQGLCVCGRPPPQLCESRPVCTGTAPYAGFSLPCLKLACLAASMAFLAAATSSALLCRSWKALPSSQYSLLPPAETNIEGGFIAVASCTGHWRDSDRERQCQSPNADCTQCCKSGCLCPAWAQARLTHMTLATRTYRLSCTGNGSQK